MSIKHLFLTAAALLLSTAGLMAQQVEQVTIGDNLNYGLTYSLPLTRIDFLVSAQVTRVEAGPFAPYAEKYLGLHDVPQADETRWEIRQIEMRAAGQPDSARTYHIQFSEKGAMPTFYLSDSRCLLAINQQPALPAAAPEPAPAETPRLVLKPTDVMTSDILKAGSKAKQAELVADEIFSLRESRADLIRGEADNVPNDGQQLQLMLDNLTAQEEALLSLFVGNTTVTTEQRTFSIVPETEVSRQPLFRLSRQLGFVAPDDLAGAPYYVSVALLEDNRMPPMDVKALKRLEHGIAHCVPGKARLTLFTARETLVTGDFPIAQFGHVEQLPQAQFTDRKKTCSAEFVPSTGALQLFLTSVAE